MTNILKPKRSYTQYATPTTADLAVNELCVNWTDRVIYVRSPSDEIISIELSGGGGGGGITWSTVPASPTAAGAAGSVAYDSSYLYVAVANSSWKRVLLSTWDSGGY